MASCAVRVACARTRVYRKRRAQPEIRYSCSPSTYAIASAARRNGLIPKISKASRWLSEAARAPSCSVGPQSA